MGGYEKEARRTGIGVFVGRGGSVEGPVDHGQQALVEVHRAVQQVHVVRRVEVLVRAGRRARAARRALQPGRVLAVAARSRDLHRNELEAVQRRGHHGAVSQRLGVHAGADGWVEPGEETNGGALEDVVEGCGGRELAQLDEIGLDARDSRSGGRGDVLVAEPGA